MNGEDALKERIDGVERMFTELRKADQEAVKVLAGDVKERFTGFPGEYAKKAELDQIRATAVRLDRDALSRESYNVAHDQLEKAVEDKLSLDVFEATVREWTVWRADVDRTRSEAVGSAMTWKRVLGLLGVLFVAVSAVESLIILIANNKI